jgi:hypothetical protein
VTNDGSGPDASITGWSDAAEAVPEDSAGSSEYLEQTYEPPDVDDPVYLHDHHIFPRQFIDEFIKSGIDIDKFTATMHEFQHQILHSEGWNSEWNMFFEMYREADVVPGVDDVMGYGVFLMEKYGFSDAALHTYRDKSGDLGPYV